MYAHVEDIRFLADEWRGELEDAADDQDRTMANAKYGELCEALSVNPTPEDLEHFGENYEPTLIHENSFEEYARELAEDIDAIPDDAPWPIRCIDWEQAADELRMDYTMVSFNGDDYYIRSW